MCLYVSLFWVFVVPLPKSPPRKITCVCVMLDFVIEQRVMSVVSMLVGVWVCVFHYESVSAREGCVLVLRGASMCSVVNCNKINKKKNKKNERGGWVDVSVRMRVILSYTATV